MEKFNFLSSLMNFLPVRVVFRTLTPIALLLGVGIGFIGSFTIESINLLGCLQFESNDEEDNK